MKRWEVRANPQVPLTIRRRITFRICAVLLGLAPLVVLELFLRAADWGRPSDFGDPFSGFRAISSLFVLNEDESRYEIAQGRQLFFRPDSFTAKKDPKEFRVFCLGGSTVQGRPFSIETSFGTWLELGLQAADPGRRFEVVNCGGISYASYRLVPILSEVLQYAPDLILIYTGQNEFLEDRTYDHIKTMPGVVAEPLEFLSRLRTFVFLREGYLHLTGHHPPSPPEDRPLLKTEVDALLDHAGGLAQYHRDEAWRRGVIAHFSHSLGRMVGMCRDAGVPLILINPVCNLRDCPPFKSEHRDDLTDGELQQWNRLREMARSQSRINRVGSIELFQKAIDIDGEHAAIHYELGNCYDALNRFDEARSSYNRAKELDICPLRILDSMSEAMGALANETGTSLVDIRGLFESLSGEGIPGNDWLLDHVHPSIRGHQKIAEAILEKMVELGFLALLPGWEERRERRFEDHYASLDDFYFTRGMQRLEAVRAWARGKVDE